MNQSPLAQDRSSSRRRQARCVAAGAVLTRLAVYSLALLLVACSRGTVEGAAASFGPSPDLPRPVQWRLPVVNIAPAVGWSQGATPTPAPGTVVSAFADGLAHPRWLYVLPNGDVLVAETNAPERPLRQALLGFKGWIMAQVMRRAGAGVPSADRISLLRDADGDGVAEIRSMFIEGQDSPFGMALVGDDLYIANSSALVRITYVTGDLRARAPATLVSPLPGGPLNHHWTKGLVAAPDGTTLYVSVGSNSNAAEHGIAYEDGRAAIWAFDRLGGTGRVFASGLRNPVGMAWRGPVLWCVVNERDELGPDLVPDYLTAVRDGGFYGWPYSYYGSYVDARVEPARPDLVATAIKPDYALGAHTASLGLVSAAGSRLGAGFSEEGMFIGQHGSWNRTPRSGYKVIFVPFASDRPSGAPVDVLVGFVNAAGEARGRPVGLAVDTRHGLLVADDVGNVIWRVTAAPPGSGGQRFPTSMPP
jgi:glucose/arabinose dehydrogenase